MKKRLDKNLAEGEVTGHAHRVFGDPGAEVFDQDEKGESRLLKTSGCEVTHEEHKTITLESGQYDVTRQREIDPDSEEVRALRD